MLSQLPEVTIDWKGSANSTTHHRLALLLLSHGDRRLGVLAGDAPTEGKALNENLFVESESQTTSGPTGSEKKEDKR